MIGLEAVLGVAPGLSGAAHADDAGNVLQIAGTIDAESLCAVAVMCKPPLEQVAQILGLGAIKDWSFNYGQGSFYVHQGDGFVAVLGTATKNPETIMKKIAVALGDRS